MRLIKYLYQLGEGDEQSLAEKVLGCETEEIFLASLEIVKLESYNGEYTIEDDGQPPEAQPTDAERIAEMEEALALLLSGVTE